MRSMSAWRSLRPPRGSRKRKPLWTGGRVIYVLIVEDYMKVVYCSCDITGDSLPGDATVSEAFKSKRYPEASTNFGRALPCSTSKCLVSKFSYKGGDAFSMAQCRRTAPGTKVMPEGVQEPRYAYKSHVGDWLTKSIASVTPPHQDRGPEASATWPNALDTLLADERAEAVSDMMCHVLDVQTVNASRAAWSSASIQGPDAAAANALLRAEPSRVSWQHVLGRNTGDLLRSACHRIGNMQSGYTPIRIRDEISISRAEDWCRSAIDTRPHYSLAVEMSGIFASLCTSPQSNSPVEALNAFLWGTLSGISEYYPGTKTSRPEVDWLADAAVAASKECIRVHQLLGAVVVSAQIECWALQLVDNLTGVLQTPGLLT